MVENCGISFGLEIGGVFWLLAVVLVSLTLAMFWEIKKGKFSLGWGLSVLGGWGNFLQRLNGGCVIDNLDVPFLPIKNNIFDWLIFAGVILAIGGEIWKKKK